MRKTIVAGVVLAGGIFLFGATPAQADLIPGAGTDTAEQQLDQRLADLLGQSNGVNVDNPLRYSSLNDSPLAQNPVVGFKAPTGTPDLNPLLPGNAANEPKPQLPAADVVGGTLQRTRNGQALDRPLRDVPLQGNPMQDLPLQQLPLRQLPLQNLPLLNNAGGGLPLVGGLLMPDGRPSPGLTRPIARKAAGDPDTPDVSGLPAGGMAIIPAADAGFAQPKPNKRPKPAPAAAAPAAAAPAAAAPEDPRLHEEPIDEHRQFSPNGRPVAGIDQQYK
ncbi:hypothetical protein [Paractinoplanes atraurantiacus]|uniref:GLTT repeat-containing protein n=1 Tax=Paractinoplanes atraurantiacus TaxID=1036182 RepID=A0A285F2S7_9ACTN|nr:hypothetical protein [Actinoplanes atraurantiacus]SNY04676.1 hypothetical protein SAMN05421748_101290 [Actinoplanes atraurantiacus]